MLAKSNEIANWAIHILRQHGFGLFLTHLLTYLRTPKIQY